MDGADRRSGGFPVYPGGFNQASSVSGTGATAGVICAASRRLEERLPGPSRSAAPARSSTGTRRACESKRAQDERGGADGTDVGLVEQVLVAVAQPGQDGVFVGFRFGVEGEPFIDTH